MKEFKIGDRVIDIAIMGESDRTPYATIVGIITIPCPQYVINFDDGYKGMTRLISKNGLRMLTKLEKAMK